MTCNSYTQTTTVEYHHKWASITKCNNIIILHPSKIIIWKSALWKWNLVIANIFCQFLAPSYYQDSTVLPSGWSSKTNLGNIYPQGSRNKPVTSNFFVSSRNFTALIQIDKFNVITVLSPQSPSRLTASRAFNFFQSSITSILFWKPCFSKMWRAEQKIKRQEPNKIHNFTTKWQPPRWSLN